MPPTELSRFFVRLLKTAAIKDDEPGCREDFLTECLAATLAEDRDFARCFVTMLAGPVLEGITVSDAHIRVETQVPYPGSCLDLVLCLNEAVTVAVEIKLDAPEGDGQLLRYLQLDGVHRLAFLAPSRRKVAPEVLASERYLRPAPGREHFTWTDVFDLLAGKESNTSVRGTLRAALEGLLDNLGFAPPVPELGDLHAEDDKERERNHKNADKLLEAPRAMLAAMGWTVEGQHPPGHVWVAPQRMGRVTRVWVSVSAERGKFKTRFYFASEVDRSAAVADLKAALAQQGSPWAVETSLVEVKDFKNPNPLLACVLDVLTPHRLLVGEPPAEIGSRWSEHVGSLTRCAAGMT